MEKIKPTPGLKLTIVDTKAIEGIKIPVLNTSIPAGFPSPAESFLDDKLDLQELLIKNPSSTYCFWVDGNSMIEAGIFDKDLIIVDYSLEPVNGDIVVGVIDGEFTLKQIQVSGKKLFLKPRNNEFKPIEITESMNFQIRGVITKAIHFFRR